jgi:hypothetical protein
MLEIPQEHLQNLVCQGYMIVVELATYRVPVDPVSPALAGDVSWHAWLFMSEDFVCLHIDSSIPCCSSMAWNCIT